MSLLLAGCAGYGPGPLRPGQTEADVRARMGTPSDETKRPDGTRWLDFARGPYGKHTYRAVLDPSGRVVAIDQLLNDANFATIKRGASAGDVRERLGRPSQTRVGWQGVGEVWSYRYEYIFCRWFQVWLVNGQVREAGYAVDPACDEARRSDRD